MGAFRRRSVTELAVRTFSFVPRGNRPKLQASPSRRGTAVIIVTTTDGVEGRRVVAYLGIVAGEAVMGTNIFRDMFAGIRDIVGGRSGSYEKELRKARTLALEEMAEQAQELGADAIVAVDVDYETIGGDQKSMLMVSVNGTAVKLG